MWQHNYSNHYQFYQISVSLKTIAGEWHFDSATFLPVSLHHHKIFLTSQRRKGEDRRKSENLRMMLLRIPISAIAILCDSTRDRLETIFTACMCSWMSGYDIQLLICLAIVNASWSPTCTAYTLAQYNQSIKQSINQRFLPWLEQQ